MTAIVQLPAWTEPASLEDARDSILTLARSMAENAFVIGRHLTWTKSRLPHGEFGPWLKGNVRLFGERTAQRYMDFSERCAAAGLLCEYRPTKSDTVTDLPKLPAARNAVDSVAAVEAWHRATAVRLRILESRLDALERLAGELMASGDTAALGEVVAEISKVQEAAAKGMRDAVELKVRAERRLGELLSSWKAEKGFEFPIEHAERFVADCNARLAELRGAV